MLCDDKFWIENPRNLFCTDIIPLPKHSLSSQLNTFSRLIIIISVILFLFSVKLSIPFMIISLLFIIILYYIQKMSVETYQSNYKTNGHKTTTLNPLTDLPYNMNNLAYKSNSDNKNTINMLVDRPQSLLFCNDSVELNPNDPNYMSINQKLVGKANPKTLIKPVIVPPMYDLMFWAANPTSNHPQINRETMQDTYLSGYDVSTCCSELDACMVPGLPKRTYLEENDNIEPYLPPPRLKKHLPINSPTPSTEIPYILSNKENYCNIEENSFPKPPQLKKHLPIVSPTPVTTIPYVLSNIPGTEKNPKENFELPYIKKQNDMKIRGNQPGWVNTICGYNPENLDYNLPTNLRVGNCEKTPEMNEYNKNLFTQTIQPGVYTRNQVIEPINSNMGISFTQQFEPKSCKWDDKGLTYTEHDPRIYKEPTKIIENPVDATEYNVYDPRFSGYGTSYRAYTDKQLGQTRFMYDDIDAVRMPNYISRSNIDFAKYADSYGPLNCDNVNGNQYTPNIRALAQDSFLRSSLKQRDDLMERLMRKRNSELHQLRSHPINTMGQAGLGTKRC